MNGRNKLLAGVLLYLGALALAGTCRAQAFSATNFATANNAGGICFDTPLSITFNEPPLKGTGSVNVYRADGTLVTSVDVTRATSAKSFGGISLNYYPIIITGNTTAIYLPVRLAYNQSYYVLVDSGAFHDAAGNSFGIADASVWTFSTKPGGPATGSTSLTVAADSSGDFCTVQGAVDFVPANNTQRVTVTVRSGTYTEIVRVPSNKSFLTVQGEDRDLSVIQYANNATFNSGSGRVMFLTQANDFVLQNITLHNTTAHGGSQAEAFWSYARRTLINRVNLESFQDTWLQNGTAFVTNSYIEGDVDFMWGGGASFFQYTELKAMSPGSIYDQIRNGQGQKGNVYVNSTLTRQDSGVTGSYLARIDPTVFPYSQVVHINTAMDSHIDPVGWQLNTTPGNDCSQALNIQFWEYHSTDLAGNPLGVSQRLACSRQLSDAEAAQWSDPAFVLNGWVPNTVNASPASVASEQSIQVNWSAPAGHSTADWVGLYAVGASDSDYLSQQAIASGATTGVLTFMAPSTAGQYEFRYFLSNNTAVATSGTVTASGAPFNLTASPRLMTVASGSSANYRQTVTSFGGFSGTVNLSVAGLPDGATAIFSPADSIDTSGTSILSVATSTATPNGSYPLTITGSDGSSSVSTTVMLVVSGNAPAIPYGVNSGGDAAGTFVADTYYSGGGTYSTSASIDTSGVTDPAPQSVYQTERSGNFTYTFPNLTAGSAHRLRLHFAELYWNASGRRLFNVSINGTPLLTNFDIYATAGAMNKAVIEEFAAIADSSGRIVVQYTSVVDNAKSSGIEILN